MAIGYLQLAGDTGRAATGFLRTLLGTHSKEGDSLRILLGGTAFDAGVPEAGVRLRRHGADGFFQIPSRCDWAWSCCGYR